MGSRTAVVPAQHIEGRILLVRGHRVILDADLAGVYGTTTKALNQAVRRNAERFPGDFMFRLSPREKEEVVTKCDRLSRLKYSPNRPCAFTEHGAIMAANVISSDKAVQASVLVVRAFVRLREMLAGHKDLAHKLEQLEKKYDLQFRIVFDAIRELMTPPPAPRKKPIGFISEGKGG
jgi:hypothetical protein